MRLTTTIVDDMDLGIAPVNFRSDPVKRTAVGKSLLGLVHFLWPLGEQLKTITAYYENLTYDQAKRLITALARPSIANRVLQFDPDGEVFFVPGKVSMRLSVQQGRVDLQVETVSRLFKNGLPVYPSQPVFEEPDVTGDYAESDACIPGWIMPTSYNALAQLPEGRLGGYYAVHKGKLYLISGYENYDDVPDWSSTDVLEYDPATDTWSYKEPLTIGVQAAHFTSAASVDDWIYIHDDTNDIFICYNPDTGVTDSLTPCPAGIYDQPLVAFRGLIYRGLTDGGISDHSNGPIQVYDPYTDTWSDAPMDSRPTGWKSWPVAIANDDHILVGVDDMVWKYYPEGSDDGVYEPGEWEPAVIWSNGDRAGIDRPYAPLAVLGGAIHSFGMDDDGTSETFDWTLPGSGKWVTEDLPDDHPTVVWNGGAQIGNTVYFFGGYDPVNHPSDSQDQGTTYFWAYNYCPPEGQDFYVYGIDGDDFFITRLREDGSIVWYHRALGNRILHDVMRAWPGYGGGNSTSRGYFLPLTYRTPNPAWYSYGKGFYLVDQHGVPDDDALVMEDQEGWGIQVVEDQRGDLYALYYAYWDAPSTDTIVAAWNRLWGEPLWTASRADFPETYDEVYDDYLEPSSIALSPDEEVLIVIFEGGHIYGLSTDTGSVLWHERFEEKSWNMSQCYRVEFAPQGHLFVLDHHYEDDPIKGLGVLYRLDFPDGYDNSPVKTAEYLMSDFDAGSYSEPYWLQVTPDGGAIVNCYVEMYDEEDEFKTKTLLIRVDANCQEVWAHDLKEIFNNEDIEWEFYYAPFLLTDDWLYVGTLTLDSDLQLQAGVGRGYQLHRFDPDTGLPDQEGTFFPHYSRWAIGIDAVKSKDGGGGAPIIIA